VNGNVNQKQQKWTGMKQLTNTTFFVTADVYANPTA
jgi:hypothetical protein